VADSLKGGYDRQANFQEQKHIQCVEVTKDEARQG